MILRVRILLVLALVAFLTTPIFAEESVEQTINYLIHYVETSKATFTRSGTEQTPAETASRIKAKYDRFKPEIKTPVDFIRLTASKASVGGKLYLVRTPEGKEMPLDVWLTEALRLHRAQTQR